MKRIYASTIIDGNEGWGDGITSLFFCEALKKEHPEYSFSVFDAPCMGTGFSDFSYRHRDHINAWFVDRWLDKPPKASEFDSVLATHCTHPIHEKKLDSRKLIALGLEGNWVADPVFGGFLPPMDYDAEINVHRLHSDLMTYELLRDGFRPTLDIKHVPAGLPERYVAFQIRLKDGTAGRKKARLKLEGEECAEWARGFIKQCSLPVVLLSDQVEGGIDASGLEFWQKIYVASKAEKSYVSHSGFGMIVAAYAGRDKTKVVNLNRDVSFRNPCIGVFGNVLTQLHKQRITPYVNAAYHFDDEDMMRP